MINIRSGPEIEKLRTAAGLAVEAMVVARDLVRPGIRTIRIADEVRLFIESNGARPSFLGYNGFPGAICISVNDEVVHGIPGQRELKEGDIVKIDIGTVLDGFHGDMTRTWPVGGATAEAGKLLEATRVSFFRAAEKAKAGNRVGDIGWAIQSYLEPRGYGVVRALVGHGIGRRLHEDPQVPNFGRPGTGSLLKPGMVLAVEPMVNTGTWEVETLEDGWTTVTADGGLSAHYENMCLIRDGYPEIITLMRGEEIPDHAEG